MAGQARPSFDFFLVLDFEATCDDHREIFPMEIIEFPVILLNSRTLQTEDIFHFYVQPTVNPILTDFCTKLTGIAQEQVSRQPKLPEVMKSFDDWLEKHDLLSSSHNFCFVTCGDWDLKTALPNQCRHLRIAVPPYFRKWVNIKKAFRRIYKLPKLPRSMPYMLDRLGMALEGRHHSGIDDAKNITKIMVELLKLDPGIKETFFY
ncbi:ERI1 exoribonuclease 3-like [Oscarella lobularis]|uniref:ERI1 exoribonuclease 3-like n=1 Tax=Oscarella lobularis TaxID=121494 RepID=UPI003313132B